ncbi:hypothetical protein [Spiroplasma endosymbiont of 'Nebria riversi']|uniref:hypothetical protein n=1 Tax=Spiroplasma endosymbiont of 'Nebria riversi' TaxID=2792084 RepID=UPI001C03D0D1|nr:hypothetical protein [Spiroplasma endosymbiont of 'Nebria riversi']
MLLLDLGDEFKKPRLSPPKSDSSFVIVFCVLLGLLAFLASVNVTITPPGQFSSLEVISAVVILIFVTLIFF